MAELQQRRASAAVTFTPNPQQAPCHGEKPNKTGLSCTSIGPAITGNWCRRGRFFRPQESRFSPALPRAARMLRGAVPHASKVLRESAHVPAICATSPRHRAVDPGVGFRQAGRGSPRGRCGRRRLDPSRRDGRAFRAEHFLRPRCHQGDAPAHQEDLRRASDDLALRSLSRGLRQGRLRPHHRACRGRPASASLAAGDPRARQEGRRLAQSGHAGERDRICAST